MVSTRQPSACTASIRQPRTISPFDAHRAGAAHAVLAAEVRAGQARALRAGNRPGAGAAATRRVTCAPLTVSVMSRACSMRARAGRRPGAAWWRTSCRGRPVGRFGSAPSWPLRATSACSRTACRRHRRTQCASRASRSPPGRRWRSRPGGARARGTPTSPAFGNSTPTRISSGLRSVSNSALEEVAGLRRAARPFLPATISTASARARTPDTPRPGRRARGCRRACRGCGSPDARCAATASATQRQVLRAPPVSARPGMGAQRADAHHAVARFDLGRPLRPVMSTSSSGDESRMLSDGIRLWPPARIFAPGRSRRSNASASERGFA